MSERTDRELVEHAQSGDAAATGELFERYWRAARAAAFGATGEIASAEDAAAAAFSDVMAGISALRDASRFGPWLRVIVLRKARSSRRRTVHLPIDAIEGEPADGREPLDLTLDRVRVAAIVSEAVAKLPTLLREPMALVYFEGYDPEAAARFLGVAPGTLRRRLHEGRALVRLSVDRALQGSERMNEERHREIARLRAMMEDGEFYESFRGSLALRPPATEFIATLLASKGGDTQKTARDVAVRFLGPSPRFSDPHDPVAAAASALRSALPDFQEWSLDPGEAADRLLPNEHLRRTLPPGFAEGRPGAFYRVTRALVRSSDTGVLTMFEHLRDSPDQQTFLSLGHNLQLSIVLELTWMKPGRLDLRSVQTLLENLLQAVAPNVRLSFSSHDEPRYRAALEVRVSDAPGRVAIGGVLTH